MKHVISLLLVLLPLGLLAQKKAALPPDAPTQPARTELLLDPNDDEVLVQPVPTDTAVVLLVRHQVPGMRRPRYAFQHYGANLHLRRERTPDLPDDWAAERLCAEPGMVYALLRNASEKGKVLIATYDVRSGQVRTQSFDTKLCRQVLGFKALNGQLLVTVTLNDDVQHQTILLLDVANGRFQFLSSVYEPVSAGLTSVADRPAGRAEFILTQTNGRKQRLMLKRLSADHGQLLHSELVQTESERSLLTAQLSPLQDTSARLLAGTYGLRDARYAQGLFVSDLLATTPSSSAVEINRPHALRFYDFRHLRHFFDYLAPARSARLQDRAARREARAASPLHWRYQVLLHEMLPQPDGGYTLVAEVYSPVYQYSSSGSLAPLGTYARPVPVGGFGPGYYPPSYYSNGRDLLGIRTSHVVVCGFDKRGNLLWDNTFVLGSDVLRTEVEQAVQALPLADGRLALAYLLDNELHYKRVRQGEPSPNDAKVDLLTAGNQEKVLSTSQTDVAPWVDNQYLASGFQRIRAVRGPEREVFFLQLVKF